MKHILDSVHGNIDVPEEYCKEIIDTWCFQRLRRIEQNSCRSVFPSARHDRFIHSLGVYHLGCRIANHIQRKYGPNGSNILPNNWELIIDTYKVACLLHDVGHTPFSHTFEVFFNKDAVTTAICQSLNDERFNSDVENSKSAAPHELISAYVAITEFRDALSKFQIDSILLVRMIAGYKFLNNKVPVDSFENIMIELIHGDIIDADGLDYVCRDVWAGGYKNFSIDLTRLIESIEIDCSDNKNYTVSYSSKALNEIEAVLNVKNFQYLYVINHHKVLLEQYLLVEAMKYTACYFLDLPSNTSDSRDNALRSLCDYKIFVNPKILTKFNYQLYRPVDDDFVVMMKLVNEDNAYINQWFSRQYNLVPLWKSKLEYFNIFSSVLESLSETSAREVHAMLISPDCKRFICDEFNLSQDDLVVVEVKSKIRSLDANKIQVKLNGKTYPYSQLNHDMFSVIGTKYSFCYYYVNLAALGGENTDVHVKWIIDKLKEYISLCLKEKWN